MEDAFNKLKTGKQNSVDNLIKWMKDYRKTLSAKLIESTKAAEEKARKLFVDAKDHSDVELEKFKEVVAKIAEEQKKNVNELFKMLSEAGPKMVSAVTAGLSTAVAAGASALKDAANALK